MTCLVKRCFRQQNRFIGDRMMIRVSLTCAVLFLSYSIASADMDTSYLHGLGDTRYHYVESDNVGRGYHVYVMLPVGYGDSDNKYPTIYVLDGGGLFPMMTAYYKYLNFGEEIPDAIIVGISYGSDTFEGGNFRSTDYTAPSEERDYWGGAEKFQLFLGDELLPRIENDYRSDSARRVIFGQSIGGQFVLYTALTEPNLFWGHIASNPALHRNLPFFLQQHGKPDPRRGRSRLFVADGTLNDARFREPALQWIDHWSKVKEKPWEFMAIDLDGHSHMSAPPASFRQGAHWLFSKP
jgi:predicted alpha/beta superfamily hydrolase